jgi:DNA polymerase-3 subunit epsilon
MYLFFDTETTGKALSFNAPVTDLNNWPRIIQIGWQLYDADGKLINERCELIKPDGWIIPPDSEFHKEHGYTTEKNMELGVPLSEIIEELAKDIERSEYLIAHNMKFDINVLGAEFLRLKFKTSKNLIKICTMTEGTSYCKLPGRYGNYKWPTLTELHMKLFGSNFEGAHDALDDVKACAKSFFELKRVGHILKS